MRPVTRRWVVLLPLFFAGCWSSQPGVVLYCAQDREFAEEALPRFTQQTGIAVEPKYDTEADKSLSLFLALVGEKDRPRCDVFWNNEILHTLRLQKLGMLEPYQTAAATPFPLKAADHTWCAFAERARVLIVNTKLVSEADRPTSLLDLTNPKWKDKVVMAKPQFGTTATQAACLFDVLGPEAAKQYYLDLTANGVQLAPGNKQVAEWVGQGRTPTGQQVVVGVTDTDDALGVVEKNPDVAMIFPDRDRPKSEKMGTLFIPNTLCIIKGGPNSTGARKLVDFLLSPEVEARLAETEGHQIPMNPNVKATLPSAMGPASTAKRMDVNFENAAAMWDEVQDFLRKEFAKP